MCGVDSLNFPPTIAKLVSNILGNLHLIFLSYPVSKVYSFTFQRKGPPIYGSWTSTVLENCPVSLLFQSYTFPLHWFFHLSLQTYSGFTLLKQKQESRSFGLLPISHSISITAFSFFLLTLPRKNLCLFFLPSHSLLTCNLASDPTSLLTLQEIQKITK